LVEDYRTGKLVATMFYYFALGFTHRKLWSIVLQSFDSLFCCDKNKMRQCEDKSLFQELTNHFKTLLILWMKE
jgi:hypothetical protein